MGMSMSQVRNLKKLIKKQEKQEPLICTESVNQHEYHSWQSICTLVGAKKKTRSGGVGGKARVRTAPPSARALRGQVGAKKKKKYQVKYLWTPLVWL